MILNNKIKLNFKIVMLLMDNCFLRMYMFILEEITKFLKHMKY